MRSVSWDQCLALNMPEDGGDEYEKDGHYDLVQSQQHILLHKFGEYSSSYLKQSLVCCVTLNVLRKRKILNLKG